MMEKFSIIKLDIAQRDPGTKPGMQSETPTLIKLLGGMPQIRSNHWPRSMWQWVGTLVVHS